MDKKVDTDELKYQIALTLIPNIGDVLAKQLIKYFGSAKNIFHAPFKTLDAIHGFGVVRAKAVKNFKDFDKAEKEIAFIKKNNITPLFFTDKNYPKRLKYCNDSPILLYYKGNANLNETKILSIVGTRHATDYGKTLCNKIISELKDLSILIVSGLAYGIDVTAHRTALKNNIPTIGVVAHGLDQLYPAQHISTAKEMLQNGGLLTDFRHGTKPDKQNFPSRNRIVAGIADATLVIESAKRGGSLITAEIANSYNRDVFALPGRSNDKYSEGCNMLIRNNKAALITNAQDIMYLMNWREPQTTTPRTTQKQLFLELNEKEKSIIDILTGQKGVHIDDIRLQSNYNSSEIAAAILNLELQGVIQSMPGKRYSII